MSKVTSKKLIAQNIWGQIERWPPWHKFSREIYIK